MSFHAAAENVRVEENHILRARIPNGAGELVDAEIDLDQILGNNDGRCSLGVVSPHLTTALEKRLTGLSAGRFQWGSSGMYIYTPTSSIPSPMLELPS
jgi:hypothetical protein